MHFINNQRCARLHRQPRCSISSQRWGGRGGIRQNREKAKREEAVTMSDGRANGGSARGRLRANPDPDPSLADDFMSFKLAEANAMG